MASRGYGFSGAPRHPGDGGGGWEPSARIRAIPSQLRTRGWSETEQFGRKALFGCSFDKQAVGPASSDAGHISGGGSQRRHRAQAVGGGAVAELAVGIVAPGERRPAR